MSEVKRLFELKTIIRGRSASVLGPEVKLRYCAMTDQQPLLLEPEPTNADDPNAVLCREVTGGPVGYVAREHAPLVKSKIEAGEMLLCKVLGPCFCVQRTILIWSEGIEEEIEAKFALPVRNKLKEKVE